MLLMSNWHFEQVKTCGPPILSLLEQGPKVWDLYSITNANPLADMFVQPNLSAMLHPHPN